MSRTFTKLFSSITESTVWCEPDRTRLCWITMLAMADRNGRVWATVPGLANRARVPVEDARVAIATFLAPDEDSRTKEFEGRRIEEIDGGWRLLNHEKYRAIRDEEATLESKREYINKRRAAERAAKEKAAAAARVEQSRSQANGVEPSRDIAESYSASESKAGEQQPLLPEAMASPIAIGLVDGTEFPITQARIDDWTTAYPAVDVMAELRAMRQWCIAKPTKRKTKRGVMAFCNSWLARCQDRGGSSPTVASAKASKTMADIRMQAEAWAEGKS